MPIVNPLTPVPQANVIALLNNICCHNLFLSRLSSLAQLIFENLKQIISAMILYNVPSMTFGHMVVVDASLCRRSCQLVTLAQSTRSASAASNKQIHTRLSGSLVR